MKKKGYGRKGERVKAEENGSGPAANPAGKWGSLLLPLLPGERNSLKLEGMAKGRKGKWGQGIPASPASPLS